MCGIVVSLAFGKLGKREEQHRQRLMRYLTTELLINTEDRGKDATGAVVLFDDGRFFGLKRGERVTDFLKKVGESKECFGGFLKMWREYEVPARVFLGHCRQGTHGDKEDNENNHPIKIGNIVGIHNGQIKNHDLIFKHLGCKRDGQVDSEAIFRLFDHYTVAGREPFTMDMCQEIVKRLSGEFAVVAFNADNLSQVPVFRDRRPVEFVLIKPYGILLMISEMKFWHDAHYVYERLVNYNPDMFGTRAPMSLLNNSMVETKMLPDDHCMIFDLTKQVTSKTTIDSLGECKRMERTKIWDTAYSSTNVGNTGSKVNYYGTNSTSKGSDTKTTNTTVTGSTQDPKPRFVWDTASKHYITKIGDKVVQTDKPSEVKVDSVPIATVDKKDDKKTETVVQTIDPDDSKEQTTDVKPIVTDYTKYNDKSVSETEDVIDVEATVVEVDMPVIPQEIVEATNAAYDALPTDRRGYTSESDILDEVEFKNAAMIDNLGSVVLANRVHRIAWKKGYMAAKMSESKVSKAVIVSSDDKVAQREKHIATLKAMLLVFAKFYGSFEKTSGAKNHSEYLKQQLSTAAMEMHHRLSGLDDVASIFNEHEKSIMTHVVKIMEESKSYSQS